MCFILPSQEHYSVMQSNKNKFCGDVVLDIFNIAYRHEDSVLDQKYVK